MRIETKYSLKDMVYFFYNNQIKKGKITCITLDIKQFNTFIKYIVKPNDEQREYQLYEFELSTDIDVLLQQLKKRYK